jgi:thiol-disulfide isomerase/thioredoxin
MKAVRSTFTAAQGFLCGIVLAVGFPVAAQTPVVTLKDVQGDTRLFPNRQAKATVLIFVTPDCPIANRYAPELARICRQYQKQNVIFHFIYVDPATTDAQARKHSKDFGFSGIILRDTRHALVKMTGATVTPEAVVLLPNGKRVYRGRIDNRIVTFGRQRVQPTSLDLRNALDAVIRNKPVPVAKTEAIGCFIPLP